MHLKHEEVMAEFRSAGALLDGHLQPIACHWNSLRFRQPSPAAGI
jgi:hypothetical protein